MYFYTTNKRTIINHAENRNRLVRVHCHVLFSPETKRTELNRVKYQTVFHSMHRRDIQVLYYKLVLLEYCIPVLQNDI